MFSIFLTTLFAFDKKYGQIAIYESKKDSSSNEESKNLPKFFFEYKYENKVPVKFLLSETSFNVYSLNITCLISSFENNKKIDCFNESKDHSWDVSTNTTIDLYNTGGTIYTITVKDTKNNLIVLKKGETEKEWTGVQEIILIYNELHKLNVDKKETSFNLRVDPSFEKFTIIFSDQQKSEIKSGENGKDDISIIFQNPENIEIEVKEK